MRFAPGTLLRAALGASVVVNLVLAGLLLLAPAAPAARSGRGFDRMLARLEQALPEPDRPAFLAAMAAEQPGYAPRLAALRAARAAVDDAVGASPYDPAALRAAFAVWSARSHEFNAAFSEALVRAMGDVSPEGRARVAAARRQRDG